ncbi:MAG: hypothetical protein ACOYEU_13010, partial [Limnochordia bacterium]
EIGEQGLQFQPDYGPAFGGYLQAGLSCGDCPVLVTPVGVDTGCQEVHFIVWWWRNGLQRIADTFSKTL